MALGAVAGAVAGLMMAIVVPMFLARSGSQEFKALQTRVEALEKAPAATVDPARLGTLDGQVADLQKQGAALRDGVAQAGRSIDAVRQSIDVAPIAAQAAGAGANRPVT